MTKETNKEKEIEERLNLSKFNIDQLYEIRTGLEDGLDVSIYANPKYSWEQMYEIRKLMLKNVDVSSYLDPNIPVEDLFFTNSKLRDIDMNKYKDKGYNIKQLYEIKWGLKEDLDVSIYADPNYNWKQMREIRRSLSI